MCTVHHHLECPCLLTLIFYSAPSAAWSTVRYNTMHELRKHRHVCTVHRHLQCACLLILLFLQCSKCSMEYNTMHELRKHRRVHGSRARKRCNICGERFSSQVSCSYLIPYRKYRLQHLPTRYFSEIDTSISRAGSWKFRVAS